MSLFLCIGRMAKRSPTFSPVKTHLSLSSRQTNIYDYVKRPCEKVELIKKKTHTHNEPKLNYPNNSVLHPLFPTAAGCPRLSCFNTIDSNFTLWLLLVFLPKHNGPEEFVGLCLKGREEKHSHGPFPLK